MLWHAAATTGLAAHPLYAMAPHIQSALPGEELVHHNAERPGVGGRGCRKHRRPGTGGRGADAADAGDTADAGGNLRRGIREAGGRRRRRARPARAAEIH